MSKALLPFGIHWFRRDLRIAGNAGLVHNLETHEGRVLGLFCFDSVFLSRDDFSSNRFAFFLKTLEALKQDLQERGGDLLVVDALPQKAFPQIIKKLKSPPSLVTFNRDYEPFARARDQEVAEIVSQHGVSVADFRDHLIFEPLEIFKKEAGDYYQIYSPFAKKWFAQFAEKEFQKRVGPRAVSEMGPEFDLKWKSVTGDDFPYTDQLAHFQRENDKKVTIPIPEAGAAVALQRLKEFAPRLGDYKTDRDVPSLDGTSRFSMYFKNGSLTTAQVIHHLKLTGKNYATEDGPTRFLKELVWREFYYHILYHRPEVEKTAFNAKYKDLKWHNSRTLFKHWCEGTTGFPIVDAGMRQLKTTGWMHNRVRMIVASFLTKDLLIDWQWGENYFMKELLDGDMAPNNGGWQWAASTGCDPQPYFRVFNPWLQSEKFDPEAEYIKTYIPELRDIPADEIHDPEGKRGAKYPQPIVDHATQKTQAIQLYK